MKQIFSNRAMTFGPNIFNILNEKKEELIKKGKKVTNLSVGTPDFAPSKEIMKAVSKASLNPDNYKYSLGDTKELTDAVIAWYKRRYNVELNSGEIMSVAGTQEGMAHIALTFCNEGDVVLVPNPGYPIFETGPYLNGAKVCYYELLPENNYLIDFDSIDEEVARKAKLIIVSYPLNPTCTCANKAFYMKLIEFAKKCDIIVINDNAYSEIIYDGRESFSFLELPGAKEIGLEFNSLSKTYNLTGIRISFLMGNEKYIEKFSQLRSQFDYGTSFLVQAAAIEALNGDQSEVAKNREEYQRRRDALCKVLLDNGFELKPSEGTMFVWAKIPDVGLSSEEFCIRLLETTGIICTPGSSFGSLGEGYVRFALVLPADELANLDFSGMGEMYGKL